MRKSSLFFVVAILVVALTIPALSALAQGGDTQLPDLGGREVRVAVENAYPPFNFIGVVTASLHGGTMTSGRKYVFA